MEECQFFTVLVWAFEYFGSIVIIDVPEGHVIWAFAFRNTAFEVAVGGCAVRKVFVA